MQEKWKKIVQRMGQSHSIFCMAHMVQDRKQACMTCYDKKKALFIVFY